VGCVLCVGCVFGVCAGGEMVGEQSRGAMREQRLKRAVTSYCDLPISKQQKRKHKQKHRRKHSRKCKRTGTLPRLGTGGCPACSGESRWGSPRRTRSLRSRWWRGLEARGPGGWMVIWCVDECVTLCVLWGGGCLQATARSTLVKLLSCRQKRVSRRGCSVQSSANQPLARSRPDQSKLNSATNAHSSSTGWVCQTDR